MELKFSEETQSIRREVRRFVNNEFRPAIEEAKESIEGYHDLHPEHPSLTDNTIPQPIGILEETKQELRAKAKDAGYWGMGVPKEYGGGDLNLLQRCVVLEELSKHDLGLYNPGLGVIELVGGLNDPAEPRPILDRATRYQMDEFFQPLLDGETTSAFALTEPAAGSDPRGMETSAQRDGNHWIINGKKHYISFIRDAAVAIVFARTQPIGNDINDHGITAFLVPTDSPGLSMAEQQVIRPNQPFEIHLDDVTIPHENVLGDVGGGLQIAKDSLSESRIMYAANCLGPMDQSIRLAIEWANNRKIGEDMLANKQAIQWKIGEAANSYRCAKLTVYHAASKYDAGEDVRHESSTAKYLSTEALWNVLDEMIQIHGGMGVDSDLPLERWLRESRVRRLGQGPSEVHMKTIARNLLKGYEDPDPIPL